MPPNKKTPRHTAAVAAATRATTLSVASSPPPLPTPPVDVQIGLRPTPSPRACPQPNSAEDTVLYWLRAITSPTLPLKSMSAERAASPPAVNLEDDKGAALHPTADSSSPASPEKKEVVVADGDSRSGSTPPPQASATQPQQPQQPQHNEEERQQQTRDTAHSQPPRPSPRLAVRDAMPIFGALLAGQLGPVVLDVRLQGETHLLQHPQHFEATVRGYAKLSSTALRQALSAVQPFFLPCRRDFGNLDRSSGDASSPALYTIDPSNHYPVVPLLAQLLQTPKVTKVLLHAPLLYRLLFLFLGTDRVEVQSVVDLTTWSELGRQLRPAVAAVHPMPVDGVAQLADVQAMLPAETCLLLEEETQALSRPNGSGVAVRPLDDGAERSRSSSSSSGGSHAESSSEHDDSQGDTSFSFGSDGEGQTANQSDGEGEPQDAVALLQTIVPLNQQSSPSTGAASRRDANCVRVDGGGGARRHAWHKRRLRHRSSSSSASSQHARADTEVLAGVYAALKTLTLFYTEVLTQFFDDVSGGTGGPTAGTSAVLNASLSPVVPSSVSAVCTRLSPSEWCAQRTYACFLCELMSYHGMFVDDGVFHGMLAVLDMQLRTLEDMTEQVLAALEGRGVDEISNSVEAGPAFSATRPMSAGRIREEMARSMPGSAAVLARHQKLDASLLRALANEAATRENAAAAAQLRLACQLVCVAMAYQERAEAKQRITDTFAKVSDRVQARVLEKPCNAEGSVGDRQQQQHPSLWSALCFSVHPTWTLHNASTGRVFSTQPNVQNLPKMPLHTMFAVPALRAAAVMPSDALDGAAAVSEPRPYGALDPPSADDVARWLRLAGVSASGGDSNSDTFLPPPRTLLFSEQPQWTLRHLYRAPPGCVLLSLDYNQLELRVLSHMSGDATLQAHLSARVDVLALITASVLQLPSADEVQPHQRQAVKVIVYGLLYGMGPKAMEERIISMRRKEHADGGVGGGERLSAQELLARVHEVYPRLEGYLRETRMQGLQQFTVDTLSGCKSLAASTDANRRKQRAIAAAIQGGAADIVLCAMRAVQQQRHALLPYLPAAPLALVMTVHDELVYAVPRVAVAEVARALKAILEDQARVLRLAVPLPVSVRVGESFGALDTYSAE